MTRDDIIRMAREAGIIEGFDSVHPSIERFAALVAAAEREACAKIVETHQCTGWGILNAAIRARGQA